MVTGEAVDRPVTTGALLTAGTPVVAGTRVEETTVLRAGQSVTVAAHEVMVTQAVEYRVDAPSEPESTTAGADDTAGVVAAAAADVVAAAEAAEMAKGLEYWKVAPVASPS